MKAKQSVRRSKLNKILNVPQKRSEDKLESIRIKLRKICDQADSQADMFFNEMSDELFKILHDETLKVELDGDNERLDFASAKLESKAQDVVIVSYNSDIAFDQTKFILEKLREKATELSQGTEFEDRVNEFTLPAIFVARLSLRIFDKAYSSYIKDRFCL